MTQIGRLNLPRRVGKAVVVFIVLWSGAHGDPEKGKKLSYWKPNTKATMKRFETLKAGQFPMLAELIHSNYHPKERPVTSILNKGSPFSVWPQLRYSCNW